MNTRQLPGGTVHKLPADLRAALTAEASTLATWQDITPLARNEWICWVEGAKLIETRQRRVQRVPTELGEGKRRPCCWPGCMHREKTGR
ncbi:MAG: YdeI/OmpD-associated family protein [Candidatus Saccharimonadales bacterium]